MQRGRPWFCQGRHHSHCFTGKIHVVLHQVKFKFLTSEIYNLHTLFICLHLKIIHYDQHKRVGDCIGCKGTKKTESRETNKHIMISAMLKVCLCICFCTVSFHVLIQLIRQFAGVVAFLAGKRFLASV